MKNRLKTFITLLPIIIIILLLIGTVVYAPDNYHGISPRIQQASDIKNSPLEFLFFVLLIVVIINILNKILRKK